MNKMKFPEYQNDPKGVNKILSLDMYYRNEKNWPLLKLEEFGIFETNTNIDLTIDMEHDYLLMAETGHLGRHQDNEYILKTNPKLYINSLLKIFNCLDDILGPKSRYYGKLAVCGGSLVRLLTAGRYNTNFVPILTQMDKNISDTDVDIFFYNTSEKEATEILEFCVATIVSKASQNGLFSSARVERKLNVTNVVVKLNRNDQRVYQFIHRVYPTLGSILGGFDLGPCMVGYNGKDIVATPLGAWSLVKNAIIVDLSRRSTSFEYRILKYYEQMSFAVIFPGLRMKNQYFAKITKKEKAIRYDILRDTMKKIGLQVDFQIVSSDEIPFPSLTKVIKIAKKTMNFTSFNLYNRYYDDNDEETRDLSLYDYAIERNVTTIKTDLGNTSTLSQALLNSYSDYSDCKCSEEFLPKANSIMLRSNNIEGVMNFKFFDVSKPITYDKVLKSFKKMVNNPKIWLNDCDFYPKINSFINGSFEELHEHYYSDRRVETFDDPNTSSCTPTRMLIHMFAEFYPQFKYTENKRQDREKLIQKAIKVKQILVARSEKNIRIVAENLKGIKWITQDPQRQWTSSINPIITNPKDYYGGQYVTYRIGMNLEYEIALRLIRNKKTSPNLLSNLSKDLFKIVIAKLFFSIIAT